jgi:hypothetical protein
VDNQITLSVLKAHLPEYNSCSAAQARAENKPSTQKKVATAPEPATASAPIQNGEVVIDPKSQTARSTYFFLRKDFSNMHLFARPLDVADADGATFSYTDNRVAQNAIRSAQGITGVVWRLFSTGRTGLAEDGLVGMSFAPYLDFDVSRNSNAGQASNDRENYTIGAVAESALRTGAAVHYLRFSGGEAIDNIAATRTPTAMFEWIPTYQFGPSRAIGLSSAFGGPLDPFIQLPYPIAYRFTPEFKARYDTIPSSDGSAATSQEFRYGGQAALFLGFFKGTAPDFLQRFTSNTTYSWLYSKTSTRSFGWLETTLGFRLDERGYIALTGTYKKGRVEQTTKKTEEYVLGLSAKW